MKLSDGPDVHVYDDRNRASDAMAIDVVGKLLLTPPGQTILLATGVTMLDFYPKFIARARERDLNLSAFLYGHLDNYVWRPSEYPVGPGKEDFVVYLKENFLIPAHIPSDHFFPINGATEDPDAIAFDYEMWLKKQTVAAAFLGMGPVPEVHLAYMQAATPLDSGVHYSTLSSATIKRNVSRGETVPTEVLTVGLADLRRATHKFVLAFGKTEEVRKALTGPITTDVVATALRTDGFKESVHVYLDETSAQGLY